MRDETDMVPLKTPIASEAEKSRLLLRTSSTILSKPMTIGLMLFIRPKIALKRSADEPKAFPTRCAAV